MKQEPVSLPEFQAKFATEEDCRKHLQQMRWPNGFQCPRCGKTKAYYLEKRCLYQCCNCKHQASLRAGTIFHKSKMPLNTWFWMIFMMSQVKSIAILSLQKMLQIKDYKTAWLMAHKIRKAMADRDSKYKLAGLIEMDDANFGKKNKPRAKQTKAIIGVEIEDDKPIFTFIEPVESADILNVRKVSLDNVEKGSTVVSDGFSSYHTLDFGLGTHLPVVVAIPTNSHQLLPWVNTLLGNLKNWIRGVYHGISTRHLKLYLAEFCYKFNRRLWQDQLFNRLLFACVTTTVITFAELRP